MQHNENSKPNRFQHFLREKGYYIVLALCICAVGVSGWLFLSGAIAEKHALSEPAMSVATETEIPSQPAKTPTQPSASKPAAVTKPAESAPVSQTDEQVYAQAANVRVWPVSGETQSTYSMEQLAFNPTTRDWRTHDGVDLTAAEGAPVRAAANGTVTVSPADPVKGSTVTITVTPDKGQTLKDLEVLDKSGNSLPLTDLGNGKFSFVMPVGKVTVKAEFGEAEAFVNPYNDVKPGDWYYSAVKYVTVNGLMNGTGKGFEPNLATSRAMIWTILARMSGADTASDGEWYAAAQQWTVANGVSGGTMPHGTITREQLAAMLYRYAVSKGMVKAPATADLSAFADAGSVSSYAVEAMQWAVSTGLMNGMDGKLAPQGSATRAQVATMLMRFAELG